MFELSLIKKYLRPKWKQLSVSLISLISLLVITLVVWLVLVFLSVTNGMEKKWTEKLIALSAPLQILPTKAYYQSEYYLIDGISALSDYTYKTIEEKKSGESFYDPLMDEQPPEQAWIATKDKDLVKEVFESIQENKNFDGIKASDFEISVANVRFRLLRSQSSCDLGQGANQQSFLSQLSYLSSFDSKNPRLQKIILSPSMRDLTNLFALLGSSAQNIQQEQPDRDDLLSSNIFRKRLDQFFNAVEIHKLKVSEHGYGILRDFFPKQGKLKALLTSSHLLWVPSSTSEYEQLKKDWKKNKILFAEAKIDLEKNQVQVEKNFRALDHFYLKLTPSTLLDAKLITSSLKQAYSPQQVQFAIDTTVQNVPLMGHLPFQNLEIGEAHFKESFESLNSDHPLYCYRVQNKQFTELILPEDPAVGDGVLVPKAFRDQGILLGDRGYLSYQSQTASALQEMRLPIYVAGFYDPGLIPNGAKIILTPKKIISSINASINMSDTLIGNGINVWFNQISQAEQVKKALKEAFKRRGIEDFWEIKTYKEYEFSKDFLEQISSDKTILSLIAVLIMLVACTNIISMLILLVQQKRKEIGMMQAMGASKRSIAFIFGGCGLAIGLLSSFLGTLFAYFTLKYIHVLMTLISKFQGHQAFNPAFFGDALPNQLNPEAFKFVMIITLILSLLAGLIPAIKAMRISPTETLRSE